MTNLDQSRPASLPAKWTAEHVRDRLVEAFATEKKMPGQGARRIASVWPAAVLHDFADVLNWDDARERVWESWEHAKGAYSWEVSRMDESFSWLECLLLHERRALSAWALAVARGFSLTRVLKKRGLKRTTFYRHRDDGANRIADMLNKRGVTVR